MNPSGSRIIGFVAVLRNPNYAIYTAGNSVSLIGTWVQRIAIGWLTWELTGSGVWLGLIALADLFPATLLGPFAGAIADRTNRLKLTFFCQLAAGFFTILLFLLSVTGYIDIYSLFLLTLASGVMMAIHQPARLALVSALVPREQLPAAVAMNSVVFNVARFIGPAIAGVTIALSGVSLAFLINALTFVVFLIALKRTKVDHDEHKPNASATLIRDLMAGYRYAISHPGLSVLLLLMFFTSIAGRPVVELLPGFADAVFAAGAPGLAILTSALGAGSIVAGVWLGGGTYPRGLPRAAIYSASLLVCAIFLFVATKNLWVAVPAMTVAGFAMTGTSVASQTMIHLAVDPSMRGRVLSMYGMIFRGGPAIGALIMGAASDFVGLRLPLAAGALVLLLIVAWTFLQLEKINRSLSLDARH